MIGKVLPFCCTMLACTFLGAASAYAQTPQPELQEILKRLRAIERRLDVIEDKKDLATSKENSEPSRMGNTIKSLDKKAVQGWLVNVIPYSERGDADPLFRFSLPRLPTTFSAHLSTKQIADWVGYRGEAKLNVYTPGRHVFILELQPGSASYGTASVWCQGFLKVNNDQLIELKAQSVNEAFRDSKTLSQGLDLEAGNYDITFQLFCSTNRHPLLKIYDMSNAELEAWKNSSFNILIRSPRDDIPRPFEAKELFHYVKGR